MKPKFQFLSLEAIRRCPNRILLPDHYREDGTCKCNDPNEKVMVKWGYKWSPKVNEWVSDDSELDDD